MYVSRLILKLRMRIGTIRSFRETYFLPTQNRGVGNPKNLVPLLKARRSIFIELKVELYTICEERP